MRYRPFLKVFTVLLCLSTAGCGDMLNALNPLSYYDWISGGGGDDAPSAIEPTSTYAVALGGVATGRNELVIYDNEGGVVNFSGKALTFSTDNDNIELTARDGYADYMSGSGAKITPKKVGTTIVSYFIDGTEAADKYKVIVPPQSLIQILIGEARGEMESEAQGENGIVSLDSTSPTGNAVAAVVRTRVLSTIESNDFDLFVVDSSTWNSDPVASYWDAVITAESNGIYQFSPVSPLSASYLSYTLSDSRDNILTDPLRAAYDQAVLTAAGIFDNAIEDPTGGAFAFRSPNSEESQCLALALQNGTTTLPDDCGPGDANYPAFIPVQVLIHPDVAVTDDGRPSFVFYRQRNEGDPAVTNIP